MKKRQNNTPLVLATASRLLLVSQARQPKKLYHLLAMTAVKESWIILLMHFHAAIFFGLLLLASGYGEFTSLIYLAIHLVASLMCSLVLVYLVRQTPKILVQNIRRTITGLITVDVIISLSWGVSIMLFFVMPGNKDVNTLVVLLLAVGLSSAALSAKLLMILFLGRVLVFLPTIAFLIFYQPSDWLLHSSSLGLSFGICLGVGYVIHIQLLREASLLIELEESQKQSMQEAELRERFLRSITHDLRQPLASLSLYCRALGNKFNTPALHSELRAMKSCIDSAQMTMNSVAQLAWISKRLPPAKQTTVKLHEVLNRVVQTTKHAAENKGLRLDLVPTGICVVADHAYLERVVLNLVDNAIQYTSQGRILIGVRRRNNGSIAEVQVLDTGCGISLQDCERVFDLYEHLHRRHASSAGNMGLGLSIVNSLTQAMGGDIKLRSELGKGSCFAVQLSTTTLQQPIPNIKPEPISSVCIVDDDAEYAQALTQVFNKESISTEVICESSEIDELFNDGLPAADGYIVDYHLSATHSGLDLLKLASPKARQLLLSNFDTPELYRAAKALKVDFRRKPQGAQAIRSAMIAAGFIALVGLNNT